MFHSEMDSLCHNILLEQQKHGKELEQVRKSREILALHEKKAEGTAKNIANLEAEKLALQEQGMPGAEWRSEREGKAVEKSTLEHRKSVLTTDIVAKANNDFKDEPVQFKFVDDILRYLKEKDLLKGYVSKKNEVDKLKEGKGSLLKNAASVIFLLFGKPLSVAENLTGNDGNDDDEDDDDGETYVSDGPIAPSTSMPADVPVPSPNIATGTLHTASTESSGPIDESADPERFASTGTPTSNLDRDDALARPQISTSISDISDPSARPGTSGYTPASTMISDDRDTSAHPNAPVCLPNTALPGDNTSLETQDVAEESSEHAVTMPQCSEVPVNYDGQGHSVEMDQELLSASNAADPWINGEPEMFSQDGDAIVANLERESNDNANVENANTARSGGDQSPPCSSGEETDCEDEKGSSGGSQNSSGGSQNSSDGSQKSMVTLSQAQVTINESPKKGKKRSREDSSMATAESDPAASEAEVIGERIVRAKMSEQLQSPSSSKEVILTTQVKASKTTEEGRGKALQRQGIWSKSTAGKKFNGYQSRAAGRDKDRERV